MSAKFDEFPSLPFQDIKEKPKRHGRTDGKTDGQRENSIPPHKHSLRGGINMGTPGKFNMLKDTGSFQLKLCEITPKMLLSNFS